MSELEVTPERLKHIADSLKGNHVRARVVEEDHAGPLGSDGSASSLTVDRVIVEVPPGAVIRQRTRDGQAGIEINSDAEPEPPGTWLWVKCDAVQQSHEVFAALEAM